MTWPEYLVGCCRLNDRLTRMSFQEADVLLALLLGHPDHWTPAGQLIESIWPDANKEPDGARGQLSVQLTRLRRRGIEIENRERFGWRIPREARGRRQLMKAA